MSNNEWEQVGGIYRRKPKQQDSSWIGGAMLIFVIVCALIGAASH